jgi:hypothetical protein
MKYAPFIAATITTIACIWGILSTEHAKNQPIRCASPIDPELHIVVKDGQLDTTWIYVRNLER